MDVDDENKQSSLDEPMTIKPNNLISSQEPITLNVGGVKYQTSLSTLTSHSDCYFAKMFGGRFSVQPNKDGSYFIDRDGKCFGHILDFLRTRKVFIKNDECLIERILEESEYYNLPALQSLLLLKKYGSRILTQADVEFINKCHLDQFGKEPVISKHALIFSGSTYADFEKLRGLKRILFVFETEESRSRTALYLDEEYEPADEEYDSGYVLELDMNMTAIRKRQHHKKLLNFVCNVDERDYDLNWDYDVNWDEEYAESWPWAFITKKDGSYGMEIRDLDRDRLIHREILRWVEVYQL